MFLIMQRKALKQQNCIKTALYDVVFDSVVPQPIGLEFIHFPLGNNEFELSAAG